MTSSDQSRARALALALVGPEGLTEDVVAGVEMVLAAVRLEERRRIGSDLRATFNRQNAESGAPARLRNYATDLLRVALELLERGEHEETTR